MPKLMVIMASTRPGRVGLPVTRWFLERAEHHGGFEIELVDLAELDLPMLDEPNHPRLRKYTKEHTLRWSAMVDDADAFVFVTPEYNYGYPASLKNAIDFLHHEWHNKPLGLVSYGGVSAGTRSLQQLRQVVAGVKLYALMESVTIPFVREKLGEDGALVANEVMDEAADQLLDALLALEAALSPLRTSAHARA